MERLKQEHLMPDLDAIVIPQKVHDKLGVMQIVRLREAAHAHYFFDGCHVYYMEVAQS